MSPADALPNPAPAGPDLASPDGVIRACREMAEAMRQQVSTAQDTGMMGHPNPEFFFGYAAQVFTAAEQALTLVRHLPPKPEEKKPEPAPAPKAEEKKEEKKPDVLAPPPPKSEKK